MAVSDWTPTVVDVGAILRARTVDTNGSEIGTFTLETRPTEVQVSSLVGQAVGDVVSGVGMDIPEQHWSDARAVAALGTAMLVELSYFPEQVTTGRSPYEQLKELYEARLSRLRVTVTGGEVDGSGNAVRSPSYSFPRGDPSGEIAGWQTAW